MRATLFPITVLSFAVASASLMPGAQASEDDDRAPAPPEGDRSLAPYLIAAGSQQRLPLAETSADVDIAGVIAGVRVHQLFTNDGPEPIEAVYVFPASTRASVHRMKMTIGDRVIEARIDRRAAAAQAYEQARSEGRRASLLEQERPNVFTMKVANIMPGDRIAVDMDYSEMLVPEGGVYELVYPGVVGPRYSGGGGSGDPDSAKDGWVATPYLRAGQKEPYRFDVRAHVEAGLPIHELSSPSHAIDVAYRSPRSADVTLKTPGGGDRDYVLRYRLAGDRIGSGLLLSPPDGPTGEGFFALMVQPPRRASIGDTPAREYIFLVDVSGSMFGFPLDTAKALMSKLLGGLRPKDAFNVVLFSGAFRVMHPEGSVAATPENVATALEMLGRQHGGGGTELTGGLQAAYAIGGRSADRSRAVIVVTDGYVDVEAETFRFVRQRLDQANLFAFGIGSSVNRALIEGMARAGSGEPFVVTKPAEAAAAADRFRAYIDRPLLAHVRASYDGFDAYQLAPAPIPDLTAERPLILLGKYRGTPAGHIDITGMGAAGPFRQRVAVATGTSPRETSALRWLWARKQAEALEDELTLAGTDQAKAAVAELGLRYGLLTSQTSFVAVDRVLANPGGRQARAQQPLPLPAGVSELAVASTAELSRTAMPPGDPVLTVNASRDARSVTAYFPFGLVKDLKFDPFRERWQTRFLVPKDVADGVYSVPVVIVHRDGRREQIAVPYRIDSAAPDFDVDIELAPGGVILRVVSHEALRKVTVARVADPSARVQLLPDGLGGFTGFLPLPPGAHQLRVVVADEARNEADDLIACEVP